MGAELDSSHEEERATRARAKRALVPPRLADAGDLNSSSSAGSYLDADFEEDPAGASNSVQGVSCTAETIEAALTKAFHITGACVPCRQLEALRCAGAGWGAIACSLLAPQQCTRGHGRHEVALVCSLPI